jgi:hypothetical protein
MIDDTIGSALGNSLARGELLFETADGKRLINLELQGTNDPLLPVRMAEIALRVYRDHGRLPEQ